MGHHQSVGATGQRTVSPYEGTSTRPFSSPSFTPSRPLHIPPSLLPSFPASPPYRIGYICSMQFLNSVALAPPSLPRAEKGKKPLTVTENHLFPFYFIFFLFLLKLSVSGSLLLLLSLLLFLQTSPGRNTVARPPIKENETENPFSENKQSIYQSTDNNRETLCIAS